MSITLTVTGQEDGEVVIRHSGQEPITLAVKNSKIVAKDEEQAAAVRAAFHVTEETSPKTTPKEG